jgi:hypothetical protein
MTTHANETEIIAVTGLEDFDLEFGFKSIDGPVIDFRHRFQISMLRLGRILTAEEEERMNFSAAKVSKLMEKHRDLLFMFSPKEIRGKLWNLQGQIRGGGIKVEWFEIPKPHRRTNPPHFSISFTRLNQARINVE